METKFIYRDTIGEAGPQWSANVLLAGQYNGDLTNFTTDNADGASILFREIYVTLEDVLPNHPEVQFWAGQRFYDRHDIHINDFYFLDMSGYGGGVENIDLGVGKLAIAYFGGTLDSLVDADIGKITKQNLDLRLSQIDVAEGQLMLWGNLAYQAGGDFGGNEIDSDLGAAGGTVWTTWGDWGFYKGSVQYGFGAASDFNTYIASFKSEQIQLDGQRNASAIADSETFRTTHQLVYNASDRLYLMGIALWDWNDQGFVGASGSSTRNLYSAGIRPIYFLTEHFALQGEYGIDYVDRVRWAGGDRSGYLQKLTIAPTIKPAGAFFTRPEIRLFATYAWWSDDFTGHGIGGPASSEGTDGWSFGIQSEVWW